MGRKTTNYQNTIIYVIKCRDDNIQEEYIGSTTNFNERKCAHKTCCNNEKGKSYNQLKYKFIRENGGWDNWIMLELEKYPCNDNREAERREEEIRVERKTKLNSQKAFVGAETKREYDKLYREEHKEELQEKHKQYYQTHKEDKKEYDKLYRIQQQDKIKDYKKQWQEKHKEEIKEKHKQWYQTHKDEMNNKAKNKKWTCIICNKEMRADSKSDHNKRFHLEIK